MADDDHDNRIAALRLALARVTGADDAGIAYLQAELADALDG